MSRCRDQGEARTRPEDLRFRPEGLREVSRGEIVIRSELCPRSLRLCRLMCGRPLAFRQDCSLYLGYAQFVGAKPQNSMLIGTEAHSASAHQAAEPMA